MKTGEQAMALYLEAMKAIKAKDLEGADKLAKEMWIKSDADLVRKKITEARTKQG